MRHPPNSFAYGSTFTFLSLAVVLAAALACDRAAGPPLPPDREGLVRVPANDPQQPAGAAQVQNTTVAPSPGGATGRAPSNAATAAAVAPTEPRVPPGANAPRPFVVPMGPRPVNTGDPPPPPDQR